MGFTLLLLLLPLDSAAHLSSKEVQHYLGSRFTADIHCLSSSLWNFDQSVKCPWLDLLRPLPINIGGFSEMRQNERYIGTRGIYFF
jgi:hypothetical protein